MFRLMRTFLGKIRYRRRWGRLAAAAAAAADSATSDLNRREEGRRSRNGKPPPRQLDAQAVGGHSTEAPLSRSSAA